MTRPEGPPGMELFEKVRERQGGGTVRLAYGPLSIRIDGVGEDLEDALLRRYGPFAGIAGQGDPSLAVTLLAAERRYFIEPPRSPERNPVLLACDGSRVRYLGYRVAGWFDTGKGEGTVLLSRGDYETAELALENFLLTATAWLAAESGGALVHGTGAVRGGRGYLFFGPSGAGKSTLAANAGDGSVIGDDVSLVLPDEQGAACLAGNPFRGAYRSRAPLAGMYPLAAGFRLVQGDRPEVVEVPRIRVFGELVGNLPFVADAFRVRPDLLGKIEDAFRSVPLRHLVFPRTGSFWEVVEKERFHER